MPRTLFTNCTSFSPKCTEFRTVMKRSRIHPNATKLIKTWVYGRMGWTMCVCCENVRHDFVAQTFFTYCTSSAQIAPSFAKKRNDPKCTQTLWNLPKKLLNCPMGWTRCVRYKNVSHDFVAQTFSLITPVRPKLHRVSQSNETVPDAPKHYETHQNMNLGSNGLDQVRSLQKCPTRPRGTYFFH